MKLLKSEACHSASDGGNVHRMTVMGDAWMDMPSDRGSTPRSSTKSTLLELLWLKKFGPFEEVDIFVELFMV